MEEQGCFSVYFTAEELLEASDIASALNKFTQKVEEDGDIITLAIHSVRSE